MPRKKKTLKEKVKEVFTPVTTSTFPEAKITVVTDLNEIQPLELNLGREDLNKVVEKLNEVIKKVNK